MEDLELLLRRVHFTGSTAYRLIGVPVPYTDLSGVPVLTGPGVSVSFPGGIPTYTISGGSAGASPTSVVITVPAGSITEHRASVADAAATASSKITASLVWGGDDDENGLEELTDMAVFAVPSEGSIAFTLTHSRGQFSGPFTVRYTVSP